MKERIITNGSNDESLNFNYFNFFEYAPIALWIEDFSKAKLFIENKLKEHNTNLIDLLNKNPHLIPELASLVTIKDVNKTAVQLYKAKSKKDLLNNLNIVFTEKSNAGFAKLIVDVLLGRTETELETVNKTIEGEEFDILIRFKVANDSIASLENVVISIENITEKVKIRNKLKESESRYKQSQSIAKLGSWFYNFKTNETHWSDEAFNMVEIEPQSIEPSLSFFESFIHEDDRAVVCNFSLEHLLKNTNQQLNYRIITSNNKLKYLTEKRSVIVEDGKIVKIIGIAQDVTESVLAEHEINLTKDLLSDTISSIKEGFILLDSNANYVYLNQRAADLLGRSVDYLLGKNIWIEYPEKEGDIFYDNFQIAIKTNKPISFENYFKPWNRWFENRIIPSKKGLMVFFHEITEKKHNENIIREAYNIINKSSSVAILCKNERDFPVVFASENAEKLFGYSQEDFLNGSVKIHDTVFPEDLSYIRNEIFKLIKSNLITIKPKPFRVYTKDKTIKWIKPNIDVIRNEQNEITHIQGIVEDYTEQKNTEDLFFKSNQQLKEQFNNTPLASIIWDYNFNVLEWNSSAERIFGYTAAEAIGKHVNELLLLKDTFTKVEAIWENLINDKGGYRSTNKNKTKNGKIIICDWYNVTLKDSYGNITGIASLAEDVTERKKTEELLFESSQRLKHLFNNTPLASIIWDLDFNIIEWNDAAERIFGYSSAEVKGKSNKDLLTPPHLLNEMKTIRETSLIESDRFRHTNQNITKSGKIITCDWYSVTLKDAKNNTIGVACMVDDITERVKAKKLLEKSEKKYKDIFEKSVDSVMVLKNGLFSDCNEATLKMFGFKNKEDLLKLHPSELSPEFQKDERNSFIKAEKVISIAVEKGFNRFKWYHKRKNGEVFPAEVTLTKIEDIDNSTTIHAVVIDISDRVKKEELENVLYNISKGASAIDDFNEFSLFIKEELHKIIDTSNFYIALYEESTDMIKMPVMVDEKEDLIEFPAEKSLTGYVIKSGKPLMVSNQQHKQLIDLGIVDLVGEEAEIWVGVPLKIQDKIIGAIAVQSYSNINAYHQDDLQLLEFVADQISITIQRKNSEDELKKALIKAQESDKLKSSFLANMSHEIRTPMNGIIGFSELFLNPELSNFDRKKYANIVVNSSKRLLAIVNDILDISKIEAGVVKLNYQSTNINHLIDDLHEFYKQIAKDHNLNLKVSKGLDSAKSFIEIDGPKLNQILTNLLSNSFKFTEEGGVEFGYELKDNETLLFYVKDTGVGIDKELHSVIFDRFMQANLNLSKQSKGTGLGLAISKKFVELFGGQIWIDSNKKGTSIYFTIPYLKSKAKPIISVVEQKTTQIPIENMELTILIAEDEEYNMLYMNELFSNSKINILEAFNGQEAVDLAKSNKDIGLIFMDIKMPIMNGIEAMHEIKKFNPNIPIIALSAFAMESDKETALKNGFDEYLSKPIDRKKLFALLSTYASKL
ncbi:PAS domain S-box protein [Lutibacter sp.]|uniref:PAS domain S-box protein n=1 Tax=Lutibacter sp. TaxID=1925666 RepID=UPI001A1F7082|nr:PAS domain S-box protein [Lutibacter sp.]MBI9040918.1 PAS domain S-box protein [Lutibacter sp.]